MATTLKKPSKSLDELYAEWLDADQHDEHLALWLQANDKIMYGERHKIAYAKKLYERLGAKKLSARVFRFHVRRFCTFWLSADWKGPSTPTKSASISSREWERLNYFLRWLWSADNDLFDISSDDITINFLIRVSRLRGYKASRNILANCSVFKTLTKGRELK